MLSSNTSTCRAKHPEVPFSPNKKKWGRKLWKVTKCSCPRQDKKQQNIHLTTTTTKATIKATTKLKKPTGTTTTTSEEIASLHRQLLSWRPYVPGISRNTPRSSISMTSSSAAVTNLSSSRSQGTPGCPRTDWLTKRQGGRRAILT